MAKSQNLPTRIISTLPGLVPTQINRVLRDSIVDDLYQSAKFHTADPEFITYRNSIGEHEFVVPVELAENFVNLEPVLVSELKSKLSVTTTFYDIGANFGYFTKFAELNGVCPENIYAFEASKYYYGFLKENCDEGTNLIHSRVGAESNRNLLGLDEFVRSGNVPDVVKIDVDGFEFEILQGMSQVLSDAQPRLYVEMHPELLVGDIREDDVFTFLQECEYSLEFCNHKVEGGEWTSDDENIPYATSYPTPQYLIHAIPE